MWLAPFVVKLTCDSLPPGSHPQGHFIGDEVIRYYDGATTDVEV